jgi:predicted flap endonuclease-1-like 5' DNA nuclease
MAVSIYKLRGVSNDIKHKLKRQGFNNSDQFLETARIPAGRESLAETIGVETAIILDLANRADLARVRGIGGVFSDLLEHAGIDTVRELATRRPDNLYSKLVEINQQSELAGRLPTRQVVEDWVEQAKALPKMMEY